MDLEQERKEALKNKAREVRASAYAPHSETKVGAAVLSLNGNIHVGCNVEIDSYRLTTCAEQAAICAGVANEGERFGIRGVVISSDGSEQCPPCGACLQTINQFADDALIVYPGGDGPVEGSLTDLLPEAFELSEGQPVKDE